MNYRYFDNKNKEHSFESFQQAFEAAQGASIQTVRAYCGKCSKYVEFDADTKCMECRKPIWELSALDRACLPVRTTSDSYNSERHVVNTVKKAMKRAPASKDTTVVIVTPGPAFDTIAQKLLKCKGVKVMLPRAVEVEMSGTVVFEFIARKVEEIETLTPCGHADDDVETLTEEEAFCILRLNSCLLPRCAIVPITRAQMRVVQSDGAVETVPIKRKPGRPKMDKPFDINAHLEERSKNKYKSPCVICGTTVEVGAGKLLIGRYKSYKRQCYCLRCHASEVNQRGEQSMEEACGIA